MQNTTKAAGRIDRNISTSRRKRRNIGAFVRQLKGAPPPKISLRIATSATIRPVEPPLQSPRIILIWGATLGCCGCNRRNPKSAPFAPSRSSHVGLLGLLLDGTIRQQGSEQ